MKGQRKVLNNYLNFYLSNSYTSNYLDNYFSTFRLNSFYDFTRYFFSFLFIDRRRAKDYYMKTNRKLGFILMLINLKMKFPRATKELEKQNRARWKRQHSPVAKQTMKYRLLLKNERMEDKVYRKAKQGKKKIFFLFCVQWKDSFLVIVSRFICHFN